MMHTRKRLLHLICSASALGFTACGGTPTSDSQLTDASNTVTITTAQEDGTETSDRKRVPYWYQVFSPLRDSANSIAKFYGDNQDLLLQSDLLPETLHGLWYMDGNILSSGSFAFANPLPLPEGDGVAWRLADQLFYSWANASAGHKAITNLFNGGDSYRLRFRDCPADVVAERLALGDPTPECTAADREYAVLIPVKEIAGKMREIPQSLVFFDMYLKPQEPGQDYLVWERRSKLIKVLEDILGKLGWPKEEDFNRYQLTQILAPDGSFLQSYAKYETDMLAKAEEYKLPPEEAVFLICYDGPQGCERDQVVQGKKDDLLEPVEPQSQSRGGPIGLFLKALVYKLKVLGLPI